MECGLQTQRWRCLELDHLGIVAPAVPMLASKMQFWQRGPVRKVRMSWRTRSFAQSSWPKRSTRPITWLRLSWSIPSERSCPPFPPDPTSMWQFPVDWCDNIRFATVRRNVTAISLACGEMPTAGAAPKRCTMWWKKVTSYRSACPAIVSGFPRARREPYCWPAASAWPPIL